MAVGRLPSGLCLQQASAKHCFPRGHPALPAAQGSGRTPGLGSVGTCSSAADSGCFTGLGQPHHSLPTVPPLVLLDPLKIPSPAVPALWEMHSAQSSGWGEAGPHWGTAQDTGEPSGDGGCREPPLQCYLADASKTVPQLPFPPSPPGVPASPGQERCEGQPQGTGYCSPSSLLLPSEPPQLPCCHTGTSWTPMALTLRCRPYLTSCRPVSPGCASLVGALVMCVSPCPAPAATTKVWAPLGTARAAAPWCCGPQGAALPCLLCGWGPRAAMILQPHWHSALPGGSSHRLHTLLCPRALFPALHPLLVPPSSADPP